MKTINQKLLFTILTLTLTGCMPDSLTKFQKSTPTAQTTTTGVVVTDSSGNVISGSSITYPTLFKYTKDSSVITEWDLTVGEKYSESTLGYYLDGSFSSLGSTTATSLFLRCEIDTSGATNTATLPTGMTLNSSTCLISGTPTSITSDISPNLGKAISYRIKYIFKNGKNQSGTSGNVTCSTTECYILSDTLKIGAFKAPTNLKYTQNDKLGLELKNVEDINLFTASNYISSVYDAIGLEQIVDTNKNVLYVLKGIPLQVPTAESITGYAVGDTLTTYDTLYVSSTASLVAKDTVTSASGYSGTITYVGTGYIRVARTTSTCTLVNGATISNGTVSPTLSLGSDTLTLNTTSGLGVGNSITIDKYQGTITAVTASTITVSRSCPSANKITTGTSFTYGSGTYIVNATSMQPYKIGRSIRGTILGLDSTDNVIRVTQDPNYTDIFTVDDSITKLPTTTSGSSLANSVYSIDTTETIANDENVDANSQYYSAKAAVKYYVNYYAVGKAITALQPLTTINDTLSTINGVTYSINPALPSGLSFSTSTGAISGTFASELTPTLFTITATNKLGSYSYSFKLAAINPPEDLSYTQNQLLTVTNDITQPQTLFNEGSKIFKSIVTPETESVYGVIKRKFANSSYISFLEVESANGAFAPGAIIDANGKSFVSEKAYISATDKVYNYNTVVYVDDTSIFTVGGFVSSLVNSGASIAYGRITYINSSTNALYIQLLTPSATTSSTVYTFEDTGSATLCNSETYSGSCSTANITKIEASNYHLTLASNSIFDYGYDLTGLTAGTTYIGAYVYNVGTSNDINVSNVTKTPGTLNASNVVTAQSDEFVFGQTVVAGEYYTGPTTTVQKVESSNAFMATRGSSFYLTPNLSNTASSVTYSITPTLPTGLSLDTSTGVISGTPTIQSPMKSYLVTAKNLLGSSVFKFKLEVVDYFSIAEGSTATSYQLHKVGDTQNNRACRINAADIKRNGSTTPSKIRCYLDGQEEDLHFEKLNLKALVGPGVCEYIQYIPFSYWTWSPKQAASGPLQTVTYVNGCTTAPELAGYSDDGIGIAASKFTSANPTNANYNYCPGNYQVDDEEFPNCDEGKFTVKTYTTGLDTNGNCATTSISTTTVNCGGTAINCLGGPVHDGNFLTEAQLKKGARSLIYSVSDGSTVSVTHKSPSDFLDITNLRVANGSRANKCSENQIDSDALSSTVAAKSKTASPFSATTNPYYTFNCLDAAYDVKAQIKLVIRDWDKSFKVTDGIDALAPTKMNQAGSNYYSDWDNNYAGGTANYGSCAAGGTEYLYPEDNI